MNTKYTFGYFYPTSPNSKHFKMPKGGYHVSKFSSDGISLIPIVAFKSEKEASKYCNKLFDEQQAFKDKKEDEKASHIEAYWQQKQGEDYGTY